MNKYFTVNAGGCSIRCKLYAGENADVRKVILFGHGFGGHKDNRAAEKFAGKLLAKHKDAAVITFDWPCHGEDGRKNLTLEDCDTYLSNVLWYAKETLHAEDLCGYATSFGAFLFLKYTAEHGMPFRKLALRCPAVNMYDSLCSRIMKEEDHEKLAKGKPVLVGFDRKVRITQEFLKELSAADITKNEYFDWADDILILHGTSDEVVPFDSGREFAEQNLIEFIPVEKADHRFQNPVHMSLANKYVMQFFDIR